MIPGALGADSSILSKEAPRAITCDGTSSPRRSRHVNESRPAWLFGTATLHPLRRSATNHLSLLFDKTNPTPRLKSHVSSRDDIPQTKPFFEKLSPMGLCAGLPGKIGSPKRTQSWSRSSFWQKRRGVAQKSGLPKRTVMGPRDFPKRTHRRGTPRNHHHRMMAKNGLQARFRNEAIDPNRSL